MSGPESDSGLDKPGYFGDSYINLNYELLIILCVELIHFAQCDVTI